MRLSRTNNLRLGIIFTVTGIIALAHALLSTSHHLGTRPTFIIGIVLVLLGLPFLLAALRRRKDGWTPHHGPRADAAAAGRTRRAPPTASRLRGEQSRPQDLQPTTSSKGRAGPSSECLTAREWRLGLVEGGSSVQRPEQAKTGVSNVRNAEGDPQSHRG